MSQLRHECFLVKSVGAVYPARIVRQTLGSEPPEPAPPTLVGYAA